MHLNISRLFGLVLIVSIVLIENQTPGVFYKRQRSITPLLTWLVSISTVVLTMSAPIIT
ncbi:MAG: hypothetical protein ACRCX1_11910 [Bacteroidales bacterium]